MAANDQGSIKAGSAYDSVNYFTILPDGATYRLDADMYHAEDLDGVMEGLLGSGNLNHLVMQSDRLGGLSDPASSSADVLADDSLTTTAQPSAAAGSVPVTDDDIEAASRSDGSGGEATTVATGESADLRGAPQPVEVASLAGGSTSFIAGGDQPSPVGSVATGADQQASEEEAATDAPENTTPPEELQPPSADGSPGNGGSASGDPAESRDDVSATVAADGLNVDVNAGGLADIEVALALDGIGAAVDGLSDVGVDIDGLVDGTIGEALNDVLDAAEDVLSEDGIVDEVVESATEVVDGIGSDVLDVVEDVSGSLGIGDGGVDVVSALDVAGALKFGGGGENDADDRDLAVDINQNLIDPPLVDTPIEADLDAIENIVGDVDLEVDLTLNRPELPTEDVDTPDLTNEFDDAFDAVVSSVEAALADVSEAVSASVPSEHDGSDTDVVLDADLGVGEVPLASLDAAVGLDPIESVLGDVDVTVAVDGIDAPASGDVDGLAEGLASVSEAVSASGPSEDDGSDTDVVLDVDVGVGEVPLASLDAAVGLDPIESVLGDVDVTVAVDGIDAPASGDPDGLSEGLASVSEAVSASVPSEGDGSDTDVVLDVDVGVGEVPLASLDAAVGLDPAESVLGDVDVTVAVDGIDAPVSGDPDGLSEDLASEASDSVDSIVSEIEVDLDALGEIIDVADGDFIADLATEHADALGTLEESCTELADVAANISEKGIDGLPEPTGLVGEGIGLLVDVQVDQSLGGGLFG